MADETELEVSPQLGQHFAESMEKVRKTVCLIWLFYNVYLQRIMDGNEPTNAEVFLDLVRLEFGDPSYNV